MVQGMNRTAADLAEAVAGSPIRRTAAAGAERGIVEADTVVELGVGLLEDMAAEEVGHIEEQGGDMLGEVRSESLLAVSCLDTHYSSACCVSDHGVGTANA